MVKKKITQVLAGLYGAGLKVSQSAYRKVPLSIRKVNARVISIGNITWGGTGKTPFTARLAQELSKHGKKVAILTRGYGQDEVLELRRQLPHVPVVVGRDRIHTAQEAIRKFGAEILILDDGFQHIRLHRDLDVVMINSTHPFGPGGLIPQGTLREPVEHLSRADIFVLTKCNIGSKNVHWIEQKILSLKPEAVIFEAVHQPVSFLDVARNRTLPLEAFRGKKVAAISGIADPISFEKSVEDLGAEISFAARFNDHHPYRFSDLREFVRRALDLGIKDFVTTQKDFIKLEPFFKKHPSLLTDSMNFFVLQIEFLLNDEEDFLRRCLNS